MVPTFKYIINNKDIASQKDYPYTATDDTCKKVTQRYALLTSFVEVPKNSTAALKATITQQSISVAVFADNFIFKSYRSGVIIGDACGIYLDHAVLAVG